MAIAKIKKLEIIGLERDKEALLGLLQNLGIVELISPQAQNKRLISPTADNETNLSEIEEAISFLSSFKENTSLLGGIVALKPFVYQKQIQEVVAAFDYKNLLSELSRLRNCLRSALEHKERLAQEKQHLLPWRNLRIPLEEMHYKQHCGILLGMLSRRNYQHLCGDLEKDKINLFTEVVSQDKANVYLVILYLQEDFQRLEAVLKNYHFNFHVFSRSGCATQERISEIDKEALALEGQIRETMSRITSLAEQQYKLMVVHDYLFNVRKARGAGNNLDKQQFTFSLSGWAKDRDVKLLKREFAAQFKDIAIFLSVPQPDEEIPVALENRRFIQPFEFITSIYGMPKYNEIDPTPYLAPFFFLYFGFCVSDAGYGLLVMLACALALKKLRLGPQGKRFFKLFFYCGISTVVIGALTGSWFGNLLDLAARGYPALTPVKNFKDALIVLDPLKEPTKLLGIALFLGIIQIWFGNIVAVIGNCKNRRYLDILFDQVPILVLLFGLTGLGLSFLKIISLRHLALFKYTALAGSLGLILTQGRSEKGLGGKLFYGIYYLYNNLSGYLSDVLSYSRLWALGMVTSVMANTINLIGIQFSAIFSGLVPLASRVKFIRLTAAGLILITVFVVGHLAAFLMNLLGAFVHPLRLQFVEFFSKFFKSGGATFKPFRIETKYININQ